VHTQINVSTSEEVFFSPIKRVFVFFSRSGTTADGSSHSEAGGGAVEAQVVQQQQSKSGENARS
jgi:hypothetical protein